MCKAISADRREINKRKNLLLIQTHFRELSKRLELSSCAQQIYHDK